jgi:hypothetical protein
MRPAGWWTFAYGLCKFMQWLCGVGLVLFAVIQPMDPNLHSTPILGLLVDKLQPYSRPAVVALGGGIVIFKWFAYCIGPPWIWAAIQAIFDEFRERCFVLDAKDPVHYHRVTLFQHVRAWRLWKFWLCVWSWRKGHYPWSGWLVAVARSGHTTKRCESRFLAPDNADHAEGVAGQAWATNDLLLVDNLPSLDMASSDEIIAEYAQRTFVPEEWVRIRLRKSTPMPRSLCGAPVEVDGKIWGVLVLDSRSERGIKRQKVSDLIDFVGTALRHLLRRAK